MNIRIVRRDGRREDRESDPSSGEVPELLPGGEVRVWRASKSSPKIRCADDLLEQIRRALEIHAAIVEDLLQPAVSTEVTGFLFGKNEGDTIEVLTFRPIATAYPTRPAPQLADEYNKTLRQALVQAREDEKLSGLEVVGWYRSIGLIGLIDLDLEIYNKHCPEAWQVCMLFEIPARASTKIGFLYRDSDSSIRAAIEHPAIPPFLLPDMKPQNAPWELSAGAAASTWKRAGLAFALGLVGVALGFLFYEMAVAVR